VFYSYELIDETSPKLCNAIMFDRHSLTVCGGAHSKLS